MKKKETGEERSKKWKLDELVAEIAKVAEENDTTPTRIGRSDFLAAMKGQVTDWNLSKFGGYYQIVATHFPPEEKDAAVVQGQKNHVTYVRKLEREVGNRSSFQEKLIQDLSSVLANSKFSTVELNRDETKKFLNSMASHSMKKAEEDKRSVVTLWSDQHLGANVFHSDVADKNAYNWEIGARRLGKLVEQVATYKVERRYLHEELVILLAGDNIGGVIHNQEGPDYDLMVFQICGATSYYKQAISFLKGFYSKIRVVCQPGNHGRVGHKLAKTRALCQKYDSFENVIFYALSSSFAGDKQVSFEVSRAPFSDVRIQGHRVYMTHGDTVFSLGNVSNNVKMSALELQVNRINGNERDSGFGAYELFCLGHVHHPMVTELASGARIAINGSMIGMDSYALGIGVHGSSPAQLIWEATEKYVQGDVRIVNVRDADQKKDYERIIRPYKYELKEES